jgi:hypothetical protein
LSPSETKRKATASHAAARRNASRQEKGHPQVVEMPVATLPAEPSLDDPGLYFNRELSLLEFSGAFSMRRRSRATSCWNA